MDILYISFERLNQLRAICSDELLINVLGQYADKHKLVISTNNHPSGLWCIDLFPKEGLVSRLNQAYVYVAFAYLGGFFQFEEGVNVFGDMNLLSELLKRGMIVQDEYDTFVHMIYNARHNIESLKFNNEGNAPE